jgi:hypothetical protein
LFVADAIIMDHVASSSVRFAAPTCPGVDVAWDGFRELGIWTKPGSRFLCINLGWVPRARLISTGRSSQNRVSC